MFRDPDKARLSEEIQELTKRLGALRGEAEKLQEIEALNTRIDHLKRQVADLEINRNKQNEEFEKRDREIKHKVGLEQTRQKVELEQARKQAELEVREKNLDKDQKRFDDHVKFMETRMTQEVNYVKEIAEKILDRLPHVEALVGDTTGKRTAKRS